MRLGLNLGYWGAGNDAENLELAREADRLGYAVCWAAEAYGSDAPTVLSWVAAQTERIVQMVAKARRNLPGMDLVVLMIVDFDGTVIAHGTTGRTDEIITAEVRPDLVREARRGWGVENNIYQLGHRGYVAVKGGAQDCPYTYMTDLASGSYRLPWEDEVAVVDGTSCGFDAPTRRYRERSTSMVFPAMTGVCGPICHPAATRSASEMFPDSTRHRAQPKASSLEHSPPAPERIRRSPSAEARPLVSTGGRVLPTEPRASTGGTELTEQTWVASPSPWRLSFFPQALVLARQSRPHQPEGNTS